MTKVGIKSIYGLLSPVLGLKEGLWVFRKSQKISTASDQYFLSYKKKKLRGGGQINPPSRNRVKEYIGLLIGPETLQMKVL